MDFFTSGSGRRLIAAAIGVLALVLNKKLGIELDEATQMALAAIIATYIGGSNWKEGQVAKASSMTVDSTARIDTLEAAIKELRKGPQP